MRLLVFSAYYEPEVAASLYLMENLLEELTKKGWEIILYTPVPTRGITKEIRKEYKSRKRESKYDGKLKIHRISMMDEGKNPLLRAFRYALVNAAFLVKGLTTEADVIFVQSTPPILGLVCTVIKKVRGIPFVYNLQDIFPDSLVSTGLTKRNSTLWKLGRLVENFTYKNADKIIVISEDFKKNILAKKVPEEKIEVVYNWVDETAVKPVAREQNELFDEFNLDRNLFYVVYAGNLGNAQNIDIILKVADRLQEYQDIQFLIFGKGVLEQEYKKMAENMSLSNVHFFPIQPYEKISQVYSLGNCSVVSCKPGFGGIGMPSKTWSIMSAGTPVLANFDDESDLKRIIEENNIGIFTCAGDTEAFEQAILTFYKDSILCETMGENERQYILNNLTIEIGTQKIVNLIHSVNNR